MANPKKKVDHPWLMAACICNLTLEESDHVISIIRIAEKFTVTRPPGLKKGAAIPIPFHIMLGFKSGDVKGERHIRLLAISPKGKRKKVFDQPVEFLGGDTGVNMRITVLFGCKSPGTHWIEVYAGNWLATRMPLTIVFQDQASPQSQDAEQGPSRKQS
jgi:hypothetical protein